MGDRLFIYSDGIEVAFADDQVTDLCQWRTELERRRPLGIPTMLEEFSNNIDSQSGSLTPKDDLTIIVMEVETGIAEDTAGS